MTVTDETIETLRALFLELDEIQLDAMSEGDREHGAGVRDAAALTLSLSDLLEVEGHPRDAESVDEWISESQYEGDLAESLRSIGEEMLEEQS